MLFVLYFSWSLASMLDYRVKGLPWWFSGKIPTCNEGNLWSLSWKDPLEKRMATHSSILAWRISRAEEPCRSMGSKRVALNSMTNFHFHRVTVKCVELWTFVDYLRKWFAFGFFLVKGKVSFLSVLQIMRTVRIYIDMGKEAIRSRIQQLRLNFWKRLLRSVFPAQQTQSLRERTTGVLISRHMCGFLVGVTISRCTSKSCKRLSEKATAKRCS